MNFNIFLNNTSHVFLIKNMAIEVVQNEIFIYKSINCVICINPKYKKKITNF